MMQFMRTMRRGDHGEDVRDVQTRFAAIGLPIDDGPGNYGPTTERAVREFQQRRHLMVDGLVGIDTWAELVEAGYSLGDRTLYLHYTYHRGDDVRALQVRLNLLGFDTGREDGIFGERTDRAVREFQRNVGLPDDGIVGPTTVEALTRLRPVGPGPGRAAVREAEALRRMAASLKGAVVAIDAGHSREDPGCVGPTGLVEAEATRSLAASLAAELRARGAEPFEMVAAQGDPDSAARAKQANDAGAEILISLHLNSHPDPSADGASSYYFGSDTWISQSGRALAELIQDELTRRLGLRDGRAHAKSLPLLRETRMPAVHVEPCFLTNPREEELLRDERFRRRVAEAIAEAVDRFFRAGRLRGAAEA